MKGASPHILFCLKKEDNIEYGDDNTFTPVQSPTYNIWREYRKYAFKMHLIENFLNMNKLLGDSKSQLIFKDKFSIAKVKTKLVTMLTASLT